MPLHKIPLCSFDYVGDSISGSGTFKYDLRDLLNKSEGPKFCESALVPITNEKPKSLSRYPVKLSKFNGKYLYSKVVPIDKSNTKISYRYKKIIDKNVRTILQYDHPQDIELVAVTKDLAIEEKREIVKNRVLPIRNPFKIPLYQLLSDMYLEDISRSKNIEIATNKLLKVFRKLDIDVASNKLMGNVCRYDTLLINKTSLLERHNILEFNLDQYHGRSLSRKVELGLTKLNSKSFDTEKIREIDVGNNIYNLSIFRLHGIVKNKSLLVDSSKTRGVFINHKVREMENKPSFNIVKNPRILPMYKMGVYDINIKEYPFILSTSPIYDLNIYRELYSLTALKELGLDKDMSLRLMKHISLKRLDSINFSKEVQNTKIHSMHIENNSKMIIRQKEVYVDKYPLDKHLIQDTVYPINVLDNQYLSTDSVYPIMKPDVIHVSHDNHRDIIKINKSFSLIRDKISTINLVDNFKSLSKTISLELSKANNLKNISKLNMIKPIVKYNTKSLLKLKGIKGIYKSLDRFLSMGKGFEIDKDDSIKVVNQYGKIIDIDANNKYVNKLSQELANKDMFKPLNKGYKIISKLNTKYAYKSNRVNVIKQELKLMYKTWKTIFNIEGLKALGKGLDSIFKSNKNYGLSKGNNSINLPNIKNLNKTSLNIIKSKISFVGKEYSQIYTIESKPVYRARMPINYKVLPHLLEVTKRWWVLNATGPYDYKILPYDYDYKNNPLWVRRRDREWGTRYQELRTHPISYMPYLEDNKGRDLHYGTEEIALSVEIMLDMANILVMVFNHSASQLANCSGQEAIEFIMELLFDWLNLDSTIEEMDRKGSREHYLRVYRWFRWEAEKVWFIADKDHTIYCVHGIKYAGMLVQNILEYLKNHHFNVVPLWRNVTYMDIERQFNRTATNHDLMKELDKLKCQRHYFIETKNLGGNK